jgi:hypothetical protein
LTPPCRMPRMMGMAAVWHRRQNESDRAWAGFQAYLALKPEDRTTRKAAAGIKGGNHKSCQNWSGRHDWRGRARAFDAHQAELADKAVAKVAMASAEEWAKRKTQLIEAEWAAGESLMMQARKMLAKLAEKAGTFQDVAKLIELGAKLKRMSQGMATEILDVADEDARPVVLSAGLMSRAHEMLGDYYARHASKGRGGGRIEAGRKQ